MSDQKAHFLFHFTLFLWNMTCSNTVFFVFRKWQYFPLTFILTTVTTSILYLKCGHAARTACVHLFYYWFVFVFSGKTEVSTMENGSPAKMKGFGRFGWLYCDTLLLMPVFHQYIKTDLQRISRTPRTWEAILHLKSSCHSSPNPAPPQWRTNPTKLCPSEYRWYLSLERFVSEFFFFPSLF